MSLSNLSELIYNPLALDINQTYGLLLQYIYRVSLDGLEDFVNLKMAIALGKQSVLFFVACCRKSKTLFNINLVTVWDRRVIYSCWRNRTDGWMISFLT